MREQSISRYEKEHTYADLGVPLVLPLLAKKTVITDRQTGERAEGLDWDSFEESDRKALENLAKKRHNSGRQSRG